VQDKSVFDHLKITHVLTCGSNLSSKMKLPPGIKHLVLEMDDSQKEPIARHFDRANDFLDSALRDPNGGIVVHCFAGVSRSATVVVAYLMRNGMTFEQAMETVKTARAAANPNPNFINQLIQYEKSLQGSGASSGKSA
jgi:protein-tyrosine phosphatase